MIDLYYYNLGVRLHGHKFMHDYDEEVGNILAYYVCNNRTQ